MKWRSGLTVGVEDLTRVVNRSMVSAYIPAPLFLAAWRMVLQMSPGRENGRDDADGVGCWWFQGGTGWVYSLLMCEMLWELIVATDWEEHASEMAVRYSSLSAASWALRFFPMYAG